MEAASHATSSAARCNLVGCPTAMDKEASKTSVHSGADSPRTTRTIGSPLRKVAAQST